MRQAFDAKASPVYLFGSVGLGKSFAAAMVHCHWKGDSVQFIAYSELISRSIRAEMSKEGIVTWVTACGSFVEMTAGQWWRWLSDVSLLIVDEIGTGMSHEMRREALWRVLEARKGKPLLITGNLSPTGLVEQFDARIQSRILEGEVIELKGKDRRLVGIERRIHRIEVST